MHKKLPLFAALVLLAGCSAPQPPVSASDADDIYQRSRHQLTQTPQKAAACVAANAKRLGYAGDVTPLYGTEVMAVIARTALAGGENIAAVQLLPDGAGSRAHVTAATARLREQPGVIASLLTGC